MADVKHRRKLNAEQLEVLELLYKFRFGTNDLFAQHFGKKDRSFVFKRLNILLEQGLIGKRFETNYRIQGKPAAYYLLPSGARVLRERRPGRTINIKAIYKYKTISEEFIEYCLGLFSIHCQLKAKYSDKLRFLTRHQLTKYEYFEEFTPSVYIRLDDDSTEQDFFLGYFQISKPFFTVTRRIKQYIDYGDSGEWEDSTNSVFPKVLLICDEPALQNRILKKSTTILVEADDKLKFFAATRDGGTWLDLAEPDATLTSSPI